jgi:hypothetical protein
VFQGNCIAPLLSLWDFTSLKESQKMAKIVEYLIILIRKMPLFRQNMRISSNFPNEQISILSSTSFIIILPVIRAEKTNRVQL